MENLINRTLQWGINKGITGPNGKGTPTAQANKMLEEAGETHNAVREFQLSIVDEHASTFKQFKAKKLDVKDGIGDTCVTLILLAEMHGMTLEECLTHALEIIEARTGKMENGTFVKDQ